MDVASCWESCEPREQAILHSLTLSAAPSKTLCMLLRSMLFECRRIRR